MGGTIFPYEHAVMGIDEHAADAHEGCHPHSRTHEIGKHQEGGPKGQDPAMEAEAIDDAAHSMLPDPEMDVPAGPVISREESLPLHFRLVGRT